MSGEDPEKKHADEERKRKEALNYLKKVETDQPAVYNKFLDIMKDFKNQVIATEGVMKRVKELFHGNRHLILGFNQFLPPGYKIELDPEPPPQPKPTIEFKHAVQYVAKIKLRFKNQPEIYGEFLDILHDYQAKRTIDEVYARVQRLFAGEPDLLDEFKYFLPDNNYPPRAVPQPIQTSTHTAGVPSKRQKKPLKKQRRSDSGSGQAKVGGPGLVVPNQQGRSLVQVTYPAGSERELVLFDKIKQQIPRSHWIQFLKVLNLFAKDVISRPEMVRLLDDILGDKTELREKFKQRIGYDEWEERQLLTANRTNYYTFMSSVDFKTCRLITPSYRELPSSITMPPCSARTALAESVLNNRYISIPTGSEEGYSFVSSRKNVYEENLFKCEDERFELDMMIENNRAAINLLEPMAREMAQMRPDQAARVRLSPEVDILHIRAIARLYGEHGYEIIELLKKNPACAVPIILNRLKQKDAEWRRVGVEMKSTWRKIGEQNYYRSLDHRSFYFKQEDKKKRNPRQLLTELRERHSKFFGESSGSSKVLSTEATASSSAKQKKVALPFYSYCMRYLYRDRAIHEQIYQVVSRMSLSLLDEKEQVQLHAFWVQFVHVFFDAPLPPVVESSPMADFAAEEQKSLAAATDDGGSCGEEGKEDASSSGKALGSSETNAEGTAAALNNKKRRRQRKGPSNSKNNRKAGAKRRKGEDSEEGSDTVTLNAKRVGTDNSASVESAITPNPIAFSSAPSTSHPNASPIPPSPKVNFSAFAVPNRPPRAKRARPSRLVPDSAATTSIARNLTTPLSEGEVCHNSLSCPSGQATSSACGVSSDREREQQQQQRFLRDSRLLLGNTQFYYFFRIHRMLYERLLTAKKLAFLERRLPKSKSAQPVSPEERYRKFGRLLFQLLDQDVETSAYEDECRALLGAASYLLFTLDKLVKELVRCAQGLFQSEMSTKILSLFHKHMARTAHLRSTHAQDPNAMVLTLEQLSRQYHADVAEIVGDDTCVSVEYFCDTSELGVGLVEDIMLDEAKTDTQSWTEYLRECTEDDFKSLEHKPFLVRSLRLAARRFAAEAKANKEGGDAKSASSKATDNAAPPPVLQQVYFGNELQTKLSLRTFKIHFVPDTTDVFFRRRGRMEKMEKMNKTASSTSEATAYANPSDEASQVGDGAVALDGTPSTSAKPGRAKRKAAARLASRVRASNSFEAWIHTQCVNLFGEDGTSEMEKHGPVFRKPGDPDVDAETRDRDEESGGEAALGFDGAEEMDVDEEQ